MDARVTKEEIFLLLPRTFPRPVPTAEQVEAIRLAAVRARDEALIAGLRRGLALVGNALGTLFRAAVDLVERRRAVDELRGLSDHELADIGLNRGDIERVVRGGGRAAAPAGTSAARPPRRSVPGAAAANDRRPAAPAAAGALAKAA